MSEITNNDFMILKKLKDFIIIFENYSANISKKDEFYKTEVRKTSKELYIQIVIINEIKKFTR